VAILRDSAFLQSHLGSHHEVRSASSCGGIRRTQFSHSDWSPTTERESVKVWRPAEKKGMERPSNRCEHERASSERKRGHIRVTMEPSTTKAIIGWRAIARRSCWDDGGLCGASRRLWARVEMKTAPTPIWKQGPDEN
jgi:hypothetical protein